MKNILPAAQTTAYAVAPLDGAAIAPLGILNARLNRHRGHFEGDDSLFQRYRTKLISSGSKATTRAQIAAVLPAATKVERIAQYPAEDAAAREFVIQDGADNLPTVGNIRIFVSDLGVKFSDSTYSAKVHQSGEYKWSVWAVVRGTEANNYRSSLMLLDVATWWVLGTLNGWIIPETLTTQRYSMVQVKELGPLVTKGSYATRRFEFGSEMRVGSGESFPDPASLPETFAGVDVGYEDEEVTGVSAP